MNVVVSYSRWSVSSFSATSAQDSCRSELTLKVGCWDISMRRSAALHSGTLSLQYSRWTWGSRVPLWVLWRRLQTNTRNKQLVIKVWLKNVRAGSQFNTNTWVFLPKNWKQDSKALLFSGSNNFPCTCFSHSHYFTGQMFGRWCPGPNPFFI